MNRPFTVLLTFFAVAAFGVAASMDAAITGLTDGTWDLRSPPSTPAGETWFYKSGIVFQLDSTTGGYLANIRRNGTSYNDYEAGADLIKFNSLSNISVNNAVPVARSTLEPIPGTSIMSLTSSHSMFGGFVPRGAATSGGAAHPYAGTGFGINLVGFYPVNISQLTGPIEYRLQIQQFNYDGANFTTTAPVRMPASGMPIGSTGWKITAPGFSAAIPDGNDLLFAVKCSNGTASSNGIARFQHGVNGWEPTGFVPITDTGMEPSLIRDVDGSLLFSNRQGTTHMLWRATAMDGAWSKRLDAGSHIDAPMVVARAADGTPYFASNAPSSQPARNRLQMAPVNEARNGLEAPMTIVDGYDEFGASPENMGWGVDMGFGSVVRLADGQWHGLLIHRVMAQTEHFRASLGTPQTGCYIEEVRSSGASVPIWTFVVPEPSSKALAISAFAGLLTAGTFWRRRGRAQSRRREARGGVCMHPPGATQESES